jgi:alkylation response protein AidB-like acyl-CoA dehydrogenase
MGDLKAARAYIGEFGRMLEMARGRKRSGKPVLQDALFRQQIAQCYIKLMVLKYTGFRSASKVAKGQVPRPESSIGKLLWSDAHENMGPIAVQLQGPHHQMMKDSPRAVEDGFWQMMFLRNDPGPRGRSWGGGRVECQPGLFIVGSLRQHPEPDIMTLVNALDRDMGTVIVTGS